MAIDFNKFNPFSAQPQGFNPNPLSIAPKKETPSGLIGASNPFNQASFAGLAARKEGTQNGLGLLRTDPGQSGLGDRAILAQNGELGRKLFTSI
jgi:hypothetical protein